MNTHKTGQQTVVTHKSATRSLLHSQVKDPVERSFIGKAREERIVDGKARRAMIAQAAYFRAEKRGFANGGEMNDWLEAEREIARMLDA